MISATLFPLVFRFLLGGSAVAASTLAAKAFGGRIGGVFAAFPAVYLAAVLSLGLDHSGSELLLLSEEVSKGALVGMVADIGCALAASSLILKYGWKSGLFRALLLWAGLAPTIYFAWFGF